MPSFRLTNWNACQLILKKMTQAPSHQFWGPHHCVPTALQSLSPLAPTPNCVTSGSDFLFFHLLHSMCLSPPAAAASSLYISAFPFQLTQDSQAQQQIVLKVWGHRGGITASALESTHRSNSPQNSSTIPHLRKFLTIP